MKKITYLILPFLATVLFAVNKVQIVADSEADKVTVADQKIEISSGSYVQLIASGSLKIGASQIFVSSAGALSYQAYVLYTATGVIDAASTITISAAGLGVTSLGYPICSEFSGGTSSISVRVISSTPLPNSFMIQNLDLTLSKGYSCIFPAKP